MRRGDGAANGVRGSRTGFLAAYERKVTVQREGDEKTRLENALLLVAPPLRGRRRRRRRVRRANEFPHGDPFAVIADANDCAYRGRVHRHSNIGRSSASFWKVCYRL